MDGIVGPLDSGAASRTEPGRTPDGLEGHCLCGAVAYRCEGPPLWVAYCHCESCRRACSAPFTTFFAVLHGRWEWTRAVPVLHRSSARVRRHFCATCGSQMSYQWDGAPDEMHFYAASLSDPDAVTPTGHDFADERLSWIHLADVPPEGRGLSRQG